MNDAWFFAHAADSAQLWSKSRDSSSASERTVDVRGLLDVTDARGPVASRRFLSKSDGNTRSRHELQCTANQNRFDSQTRREWHKGQV